MLLITSLLLTLTRTVYSVDCDACLHEICYTKTKLWDISNGKISGQLAVDRTSNTLYLNHQTNDAGDYATAAVNIDTLTVEHVPDITFYMSGRAVDQVTRDLYLYSTKPGLYKYSPLTNNTEYMGLQGVSGNDLQFKELLFFSGILYGLCVVFPDEGARCFTKLSFQEVSEFVIDKNNDIFYRNSARINRYNIASDEITYLFTNRFVSLVLDVDSNVYYTNFARVYKHDYELDEQVEVGGFVNTQIFESVFDRDNRLVYRDIRGSEAVYKLEPHPGTCKFTYLGSDRARIDYFEP